MPSIIKIRIQLLFLILVLLVGHTQSCFECSSPALVTMRYFHYVIKLLHENDEKQYTKVLEFAKDALEDVKGQLKTKMLDHYAFSQIASEYEKCIYVLVRSKLRGDQLINLIKLRYQRLKEKFKNIVEQFQKRICPNKQGEASCGIVVQVFTECLACEWNKTICVGGPPYLQEWFENCGCFCFHDSCYDMMTDEQCKPCEHFSDYFTRALYCGVKHHEVSEGGGMQLDCNLEWHNKLEEPIKYMFQKFNSSKAPLYTEEALFQKKIVNITDSGEYMCIAMNFSGFPISTIAYQVEVVKKATTPSYTFQTLPTDATQTSSEVEKIISKYAPTMVVVCSILIVLLILVLCVYHVSRRESDQIRAWRRERILEDMMERIIDID